MRRRMEEGGEFCSCHIVSDRTTPRVARVTTSRLLSVAAVVTKAGQRMRVDPLVATRRKMSERL